MKAVDERLCWARASRSRRARRRRQTEQFIPVLSYRVGPVRRRRVRLLRRRDRLLDARQHDRRHQRRQAHVGGVRDRVQRVARASSATSGSKKKNGGASTVEPLSTGIAYGLFDRVAQDKIPMTTFGYGLASSADGRVYDWVFPLGTTYWDQMAAMIAYLGQKERRLDKLKGKKIAFLYHDSAYGKEPIPVLDALAAEVRLRSC